MATKRRNPTYPQPIMTKQTELVRVGWLQKCPVCLEEFKSKRRHVASCPAPACQKRAYRIKTSLQKGK